jgi:hypothetical protein
MPRKVLFLLLLIPFAGCASSSSTGTPTQVSLSGNWQIQSGTAITPASQSPTVLITGSLQFSGATGTGTMTVTAPCVSSGVQTIPALIDSSGNLTLTASPIPDVEALLVVPTNASLLATGTVSSSGEVCALAFSGPGVGVQITAPSGSYSGSVTSGQTTGTVTLSSVTQSTTPNTSGQFPLTGTLAYTATGCTESLPVTGTISGTTIALTSATAPVAGQNYVSFAGSTNQGATTLTATAISFAPSPCSTTASSTSTYTGTLNQ